MSSASSVGPLSPTVLSSQDCHERDSLVRGDSHRHRADGQGLMGWETECSTHHTTMGFLVWVGQFQHSLWIGV